MGSTRSWIACGGERVSQLEEKRIPLVLFAAKDMDVTAEVLELLNQWEAEKAKRKAESEKKD